MIIGITIGVLLATGVTIWVCVNPFNRPWQVGTVLVLDALVLLAAVGVAPWLK